MRKGNHEDRRCAAAPIHTCHMGVVKALKALKNTIEGGSEYMLKHHVYKRSHDLSRASIPKWQKFGFRLMWQTDALEVLGILSKLGYRDERMLEAVNLVISKQDDRGRWRLESLPSPEGSFNRSFSTDIERKGNPSKWITLNALRVLKAFFN